MHGTGGRARHRSFVHVLKLKPTHRLNLLGSYKCNCDLPSVKSMEFLGEKRKSQNSTTTYLHLYHRRNSIHVGVKRHTRGWKSCLLLRNINPKYQSKMHILYNAKQVQTRQISCTDFSHFI